MIAILSGSAAFLAIIAALLRGPQWAFRWVYLPAVVLVPEQLSWELQGLPDLSVRRAVIVGIIVGAFLSGKTRQLAIRWRWFDLVALAPTLTFAITFGMETDFKGFYHELAELAMDWAAPYLMARAFFKDRRAIRDALVPFALASFALAVSAVYECRMATRVMATLWGMLGYQVELPPHYEAWRWGLLRACATFNHPLSMSTFFAAAAPLMVLLSLLDARLRKPALVAAAACAVGVVASLSRGPMLVLIVSSIVLSLAAVPRASVVMLLIGGIALATPFVIERMGEEVTATQEDVNSRGNTSSARYRWAILELYGPDIIEAGFWGESRPDLAEDYRKMWSIDNAYLFQYLTGGWVGGSLFMAIVGYLLYRSIGFVRRSAGMERKRRAAAVAAFLCVSGCMANVWFSPDYAPMFWLTAGLLCCMLQEASNAQRRVVTGVSRSQGILR